MISGADIVVGNNEKSRIAELALKKIKSKKAEYISKSSGSR